MNAMAVMERTDMNGEWGFILFCVGVMVGVAGLGFLPIRMARVRGSRWVEGIVAGVIVWGVLMAGSVIYVGMEEKRTEKEWGVAVASGYFEPGAGKEKVGWPWGVWVGLGVGYLGLVVGARGKF